MNMRFQTPRLSVEELEPRTLLSGLATHLNPSPGGWDSGPALSGGLPGLSVIAMPSSSTSGIFTDQSTNITNPLLPLIPGTVFNYAGEKDGQPMASVVTVTNETRKLMGVQTRAVTDFVYVNGALAETAIDYYAQDTQGNVWYFGEVTKEYLNGKVTSREGSWLAGVRNARPGIVMEAQPQVGDTYLQENAPNVAQDTATVLSLHAKFTAPYGTFNNLLKTQETSPLEPGFVENKYYLPGVGFLGSVAVQGGNETLSLVSVISPTGGTTT
jgi:hypothetical protein